MSTSPARRAAGGGAGSSPTSPTETSPYVKDSFVPRFDNTISGYKEWRKRVQLYARRLELQGRSKEVAMNVLAVLEGSSWTQCEDIDLKELEAENGLDVLLRRLDSKWKYDERVKLGSIFDTFFFKVQRKPNQSLLDYVTDFHQALRDVQRLKVDLPEEITGWLMLRRAALTKDQQHLVQSQVGKTLTLGNVEQSLFLVFGQDFKQSNHQSHRGKSFPKGKGRSNVHHAEDDEHEFQDDWNENYMDTYYENDDDQYYECDEEWDETYFGSQVDWSPTASEWNPSEAAVEDESLFDVEEFDSVYSAYADAKSRLAQLRQSRGFYPVVALVDGKGSSMSQGGGSSKSKGQSKKGSNQSPYPPKGKGIKARGKAIAGDLVCLRCGKTGHKAANCKSSSAAASGTSSPAKKRPIDLDPMVNMVFQASGDEFHEIEETYMQGESVVRAGGWVTKEPDMCIQDQGASSFLAGSEYILRYLKWLELQGYPMDTISFKKCNKTFRFGGDADGHARWMVELPVHFANISGRMQCFIVFGATPMLLGRPVLEQLGAVVDFGSGKMRILGGRWTEIERGKQDAMLLRLAATFNSIEDFENPQFDLRAKDDDHDDACSLQDFLQDLRAAERYEEMISEVQFTDDASENEFVDVETYVNVDEQIPEEHFHAHELTERTQCSMSKTWSWIQGQLVETSKKAAQLAYEARCQPHPRKKLIWEVYSGTGLLGEQAERLGADVMRFGLNNGWDFSKLAHRKRLMELAYELEPDEIYMSPKCTLWSPMQAINMRCEADWDELWERRDFDHEIHLKFCKKLYWFQVKRGAHAHIEHPHRSAAWETPAFAKLPGERTTFDQCEYGSTTTVDDDEVPIMKTTSIQTTKRAMCRIMSKRCSGNHQHARLEGGSRCKKAENYQCELAWNLARALLEDEGLSEQAYAVQQDAEAQELTGVLRKLGTKHGSEAVRIAYRLHRNLGHPRKDTLVRMLQAKNADPKVIAAAEALECPYCNKFSSRKQSAPAHAERPMDFNEQLQADTLWFDLSSVEPDAPSDKASKRKIGMLVMVDSATRFMAVRTIPDESSNSLMKAVEREWIRYFGPPKQLSVDEWSGWGSDAMMQWSGDHDIEMKISPGQSHSRTSIVERRHQLLRKALSIFMTENGLRGLDGLHTALNWTVPTLNQCTFVNGFTPMQLALGKQPNMPGLISDERTGPIQLQQTEQDRLRRRLELKASAQNACAVAEIDVKLRRALLRRFSGADEDLQPGERCLYWREVGNRFHTVQWKGPATVVAVQQDPDTGTIDTYWIAHGTVLIRAGRQHVRRLVGQEGLVNGAQRAEQAIAGLRQRRVVRTADLRRINKHTLEELEGEISDGIFDEPSPKKAKTNHPPDQGEQDAPAARPESVRSFSYEPTEPIDDLPKDPAEDPPLPVADPSSGLDLPTDPGLDLPDESRRLDLDLRDSEEPQPSQQAEAAAAPSSGEAGPGLMPEPLPQDVPIPDGDDSEADQPTIAADNTTTQSSMPEAPPQLPGLSFAERRRQHERSETSWMRSPLWPLVHDHPDPQSPGNSKRAKHHESVNIAVELFPNGCEGSTNLPAGWHYDPKTHEIYLGSTADFWSFEDGFLVRNHVWSRGCTFHTTDFPLPAEKLQTTNGLTMRRNSRIILVNEAQPAPVGDEPWFGKTLYPLTKDAAAEFGQNYVGDLSKKFNNKTIRSRGHIWSAQAAPKKKKGTPP